MAGVLFRIYIPTSKHESQMAETLRLKSVGSNIVFSTTDTYINIKCAPLVASTSGINEQRQLRKGSEEVISKSRNEELVAGLEDVFESPEREDVSKLKLFDRNKDRPISEDFAFGSQNVRHDSVGHANLHIKAEEMSMEKALKTVLKAMGVEAAVWCLGEEQNYYQVLFSMDLGDPCEETLRQLTECGIGSRMNSIISVTPCSLHYHGIGVNIETVEAGAEEHMEGQDEKGPSKESEWEKFVASVGARLTVAQVVQGVKSDANLTFDFLALLLIAAFLSALGLVENSTGILVASMLISPLMGPVLAGTFGTVIRDKQLQKLGVRNELLGLLICLLVGYAFGLTIGLSVNRYGKGDWPTEEMLSRGEVHSVWVGILVALTSGAAVAIATLGDYTGSLVGVAISASLLPPAVNAGLLWSLACTEIIREFQHEENKEPSENIKNYIYINYPPADYAIVGAISVCLALINILCIFLAGILVLKIKEVAPRTTKEQDHFWHHDVKLARDYNLTLNKDDADDLRRCVASELSGRSCDEFHGGFKGGPNTDFRSRNVKRLSRYNVQELFNAPNMNQFTWSPSTKAFLAEDRPSVQDLDCFYKSLIGSKCQSLLGVRMHKVSVGSQRPQGSNSSSSSRNSPWSKNISPPVGVSMADEPSTSCLPTIQELHTNQYGPSTPHSREGQRFLVTPAVDPLAEI